VPAPKWSGDSTIEKSCSEITSSMVGVDWPWVQTEEVSMENTCRRHIVRAAFYIVLACNSLRVLLWVRNPWRVAAFVCRL